MEKFRVQLEMLKKYHFWVLFGLILLTTLVAWSYAVADLSDEVAKGKKRLAESQRKVNDILRNQAHPNENSIKELQSLTGKVVANPKSLSNQVLAAWMNLYISQRKENRLPDIFDARYGNAADKERQLDFVRRFNMLWLPMEDIARLRDDQNQGFLVLDRDYYQNHIKNFLPTLLSIIERRHVETAKPAADEHTLGKTHNLDSTPNDTKRMVGIVDWPDGEEKISKIVAQFGDRSPSTLLIMTVQEDLWVYEALLKVVRATNSLSENLNDKYVSPGSHKAARIKRILALETGQQAISSIQQSESSVVRLEGDKDTGQKQAASGPLSRLNNRYVDERVKPLDDPTKQPYAEFRIMPVCLRVVIEQAAIPRLLAACAVSSMRIDVTSVRITAENHALEAVAAQNENADVSSTTIPHGHMGGGQTAEQSTNADDDDLIDPTRPTVVVEVQGIIYLYNRPNINAIGTGIASGGAGDPQKKALPGNDASTDSEDIMLLGSDSEALANPPANPNPSAETKPPGSMPAPAETTTKPTAPVAPGTPPASSPVTPPVRPPSDTGPDSPPGRGATTPPAVGGAPVAPSTVAPATVTPTPATPAPTLTPKG